MSTLTLRSPARLKGRRHSLERDRQAVGYHYNVSNAFYALWLDARMVYSCADFNTASDTNDQAQQQKLDLICRKLRLKPGQRLLDIGCGWGGLVMHAAMHYGVDATGITLSQPQAELAGFETRDVESLCEHYLLTLRHWVIRLEHNHDRALEYVDEHTYRVWRLYLSGSAHGFNIRRLNLYQSLFVRPDGKGRSGLPLTRAEWYR